MTPFAPRRPAASVDDFRANCTDEQLMDMIQASVPSGVAVLHARYAPLLKSVSLEILHNEADAEDLLQDVFLQIWNQAARYDPQKGNPLSWMVTLARRRSIDRLRKRESYCRLQERFAQQIKGCSESWTHVQSDVTQHESSEYLRRALAALPAAQRNAIKLAYQQGMSQREIAACTGLPLGTIKTRLKLGMRKMAISLSGFEDLLRAGHPATRAQNGTSRNTAISGAGQRPGRKTAASDNQNHEPKTNSTYELLGMQTD